MVWDLVSKVILGLDGDNGKEIGNYHDGLQRA